MWKIVFCALIAQAMSSAESNCTCGKPSDAVLSKRIWGGRRSAPHSLPWAVLIFYMKIANCQGTLLTKQYVLTAGHCFNWNNDIIVDYTTIVLGVDDLRKMEGVEKRNVSNVVIHEKFTSTKDRDENDIAFVEMNAPVEFNDWIRPICLPHANQDFTNRTATIVGWGLTEKKKFSNVPLQASLRVLSDEECKMSYLGQYIVPETMMCAFYEGRDGCQGDSGGPLLAYEPSGHYVLAGIISWGIKCGENPGVYTKVSQYIDWINKNIPKAETCE